MRLPVHLIAPPVLPAAIPSPLATGAGPQGIDVPNSQKAIKWILAKSPGAAFAYIKSDRRHPVRVLIYGGADTTALDNVRLSPLHLAMRKGHAEVALVLLEHSADATAPDRQGFAIRGIPGHLEVARVLLDRGAGVIVRDKDGWTPQHRAALRGHAEVARALLCRRDSPG
ncbi:ankyrin repeat-containing domain protein [Russula brevipes]|nr:ankyrin repeat-containing domain protein [Russula brevipes]